MEVQEKYNKSYFFICPMIVDNHSNLQQFRGCFIQHKDKPEYDNHIFLVFNKIKGKEFRGMIESLKSFSDCLTSFDSGETKVLVYLVPQEFKQDYEYFKLGKYSKFSKLLKDKIIDFHNITNKNHLLFAVFDKSPLYKLKLENKLSTAPDGTRLSPVRIPDDQDLLDIPDIKEEMCC